MQRETQLSTSRLEAFSDGVFAIAITLLILEIKVPRHEDIIRYGSLYGYLLHLWPSYLSYIASFFVIGIYWSNHHRIFSFMLRSDHYFNLLNVLFLMTISFLPFPTAILGDFLLEPESQNAALSIFCIGILMPVVTLGLVYLYATTGHRLIDPALSRSYIRKTTIKLFISFALNILALIASFHYPIISLCCIAIISIMFLLPPAAPTYDN